MSAADEHGFRWPLAALQRKREWELEGARSHLAELLCEAATAAARLADLKQQHAEQAAAARQAMCSRGDVQTYARALVYLSVLSARIDGVARSREEAEQQVEAARAECLGCHCRVETLLAARNDALQEHARQALRRAANEADAAWLLRNAGSSARSMAGMGAS